MSKSQLSAEESRKIERACEALILQIAWTTDHGPHADIPGLFTEDGEMVRDGSPTRGRAALVEMYAKRPSSLFTRHVLSNVMVRVVSPQEASATSYATVYRHRSSDGSAPTRPVSCAAPEAVVENHDRFVLTKEGWRLARRELRTVIQTTQEK